MATALFLNEQYLRDFTPLSANIDMAMIFPHCAAFQDTFIQDIVGSKLYTTLQSRVTNNNPNSDETELLNLIRPALAWGTVAKMIPFVSIQVRNIGTIQTNTDNGNTASLEQMKYIRQECENQYEFYAKRLTDYLCFNGNKFPDYVSPDATKMLPRMNSTYDSDLYLGDYEKFDMREFWRKYVK